LKIKTTIVSCHTADSKPVKQEVNGIVILPPLVFLDSTSRLFDVRALEQMSFRGKFWRLFQRIFTKKNIEGEDIRRIYKLNGFGGKKKKRECFEKLKSVRPNRTVNTRIKLFYLFTK